MKRFLSLALFSSSWVLAAPKYVFFFIGDGMALPQVGATEIFLSAKPQEIPQIKQTLSFTRFPTQGIVTTQDTSSFIPDSASTGTALATGHKTADGVIAMDSEKKESYISLATLAKKKGMKVGVVSSVSIEHATPAVFYANEPSRGNMYEIARQLPESTFDYFGGGIATDPDGKKSKDPKGNVYEYAKGKGYKIIYDLKDVKKGEGSKVWAMTPSPADGGSLSYDIDREEKEPSLADFTQKGIELLENPQGFFMMVEGGKIDWACHANDARSAIGEVLAFDKAVLKAIEFAQKHPKDTLIVVTGDHETGGFSLGAAVSKYESSLYLLKNQKVSFVKFDEIFTGWLKEKKNPSFEDFLKLSQEYFGLGKEVQEEKLKLSDWEIERLKKAFENSLKEKAEKTQEWYKTYGSYNPMTVTLTSILNEKAGIGWTTWSHTASPVPIYAMGEKHETFNGFYDNTNVFEKLKKAMNLK